MECHYMNRNRINSAMGRGRSQELVHFSNPDPTKSYRWQYYPRHVLIAMKVQNTDERFAKTLYYIVTVEFKTGVFFWYVGYTTEDTVDIRLARHFSDAKKQEQTDKFHAMIKDYDYDERRSKVKIKLLQTRKMSGEAEAVRHERVLIQQYRKEHGEQLLNIRDAKEERQVKEAPTRQTPVEKFKQLTEDKRTEVHLSVYEKDASIKLSFTVNGKRDQRKIRYAGCGIEEAMRIAVAKQAAIGYVQDLTLRLSGVDQQPPLARAKKKNSRPSSSRDG
jgi:hypothetical protein